MARPSLTWLVTTRNKLPSLKCVMLRLLSVVEPDEEVVVVDGASSDGTVEYLRGLHNKGSVHQFVSEADVSQAHATNKGLLLARGDLIKLIMDDDAFYWPAIKRCKKFMIENPDVDWLGTNGASQRVGVRFAPSLRSYTAEFERWRDDATPISLRDLGWMLRRRSLPLLGLFNTSLIRLDLEFSLRNTAGDANLAWFTGCAWIGTHSRFSTTVAQSDRMFEEGHRYGLFYGCMNVKGRLHSHGEKLVRSLRRHLRPLRRNPALSKPYAIDPTDWADYFNRCHVWLEEQNGREVGVFLRRPSAG